MTINHVLGSDQEQSFMGPSVRLDATVRRLRCRECHGPIPESRRMVLPDTQYCSERCRRVSHVRSVRQTWKIEAEHEARRP